MTAWLIIGVCVGVVVTIAFLASRSGTLEGGYAAEIEDVRQIDELDEEETQFVQQDAAIAPVIYKLSEQFSAQGEGTQWVYIDGGRRTFAYYGAGQHPECGQSACRHGVELYQMIGPGWMSPGDRSKITSPTVLEWQAPEEGYAKITGSIQLKNPSCSDGVEVDTPFNSKIVIPAKSGQAYSYTSEGAVNKDQALAFKVSKGSSSQNNNCDTIVLDPRIEFTQTVSVKPDLSIRTYRPTSATEGVKVRFKAGVLVGSVPGTKQYITTNFYIDNQLVGSKRTRMSMRAGSKATFSLPLSSAWIATKGTHTLSIVVDPSNTLAESNEGNNTKTVTFVVRAAAPPIVADRLIVKKVFLPGVSAAVTVTLDGALPSGSTADTVYWDNVTAGSHTVAVSGAPKIFYAVCVRASNCPGGPVKEGSSISFTHQYVANDFIQLYLGDMGSHIATTEGVNFKSLLGAGLNGINLGVDNSCSFTFETNAKTSDPEWPWIQAAAQGWSKSYVKVEIVSNPNADSLPIISTMADFDAMVGDDNHNLLILRKEIILPDVAEIAANPLAGLTRSFGVVNPGKLLPLAAWGADIKIDTSTEAFTILTKDGLRSAAFTNLVSHEIGHTLGLGHVPMWQSIMSDSGLISEVRAGILVPSPSDLEALNGLYGHCAPKPKPPAKVSLNFSQNPAVWTLKSPTGKSLCQNGQIMIPNGYWTSYLTLKETSGSTGATIQGATLKQYSADGTLKKTENFDGTIILKPGGMIADSYYVPPSKGFTLKKEVITFFGKDDLGNAIEATAALDLDGSYKLGSCGYPDGTWGNGQGGGGGWGGGGTGSGGGGWGGGGGGGSSTCPLDVCLEHEWGY